MKVVAVLMALAIFGAATQCLAECTAQLCAKPASDVPPCHQHSQGKKDSATDPCKRAQLQAGQTDTATPLLASEPVATFHSAIPANTTFIAAGLFESAPVDTSSPPVTVLRI